MLLSISAVCKLSSKKKESLALYIIWKHAVPHHLNGTFRKEREFIRLVCGGPNIALMVHQTKRILVPIILPWTQETGHPITANSICQVHFSTCFSNLNTIYKDYLDFFTQHTAIKQYQFTKPSQHLFPWLFAEIAAWITQLIFRAQEVCSIWDIHCFSREGQQSQRTKSFFAAG